MGHEIERRFLIVAGEASGDLHAARMVRCLRTLGPCRVRGVTGPGLEAAGAERVVASSELSVLGFSGVLARLPRLLSAYRSVITEARRWRPQVAILVDSPGFNFRLGPALHRAGIPVLYYIAPQVWAWHRERARAMSHWVDRLAVVFPFEEPIFRDAGVPTSWVSHPLLDDLAPEVDDETLRRELGIDPTSPILGLLPGSRPQELRAHLAVMIEAARRLAARLPSLTAVIGLAPGVVPDAASARAMASIPRLRVLSDRTRAIQAHATACAVASGTATLETALFGTPLVIVYRIGRLNYALARRLVTLERIGLPNIVAGSEVAPELIQDALTPERLAATLLPWLTDSRARSAAAARLAVVRERLGTAGAARRVATLAWEMVP